MKIMFWSNFLYAVSTYSYINIIKLFIRHLISDFGSVRIVIIFTMLSSQVSAALGLRIGSVFFFNGIHQVTPTAPTRAENALFLSRAAPTLLNNSVTLAIRPRQQFGLESLIFLNHIVQWTPDPCNGQWAVPLQKVSNYSLIFVCSIISNYKILWHVSCMRHLRHFKDVLVIIFPTNLIKGNSFQLNSR